MQPTGFRNITEGMRVIDAKQHDIGKVDGIKFGEDDPETAEVEDGGFAHLDDRPRSLVGAIADVFNPDDLPEELRARLLQEGFVRVDNRYVLPTQIASITGDEIVLNVEKDELIKH